MNFTLRADVLCHRLLGYLRISIPGRGIEPHSRVLTARMQSFSFVLRGEKSLRTADPLSARGRVTKDSQALSHLHLYCLMKDNKSQEQSFCFRETFQKTLTAFFTATFRIFRGHRCILNLPCVLRTCSVSRSPSHQPST